MCIHINVHILHIYVHIIHIYVKYTYDKCVVYVRIYVRIIHIYEKHTFDKCVVYIRILYVRILQLIQDDASLRPFSEHKPARSVEMLMWYHAAGRAEWGTNPFELFPSRSEAAR